MIGTGKSKIKPRGTRPAPSTSSGQASSFCSQGVRGDYDYAAIRNDKNGKMKWWIRRHDGPVGHEDMSLAARASDM